MKKNLTNQAYWFDDYKGLKFGKQSESHAINILLKKYVNQFPGGTCLELGSYPGPFLATLGEMGYQLNGVDFNPDNNVGLPNWLQQQGYNCGNFWVDDIQVFNTVEKFDLVCSFGFIEHFTNYEEIILKHIKFLKSKGVIVITTPNFRGGLQYFFHRLLDKENLRAHYLPSMYPANWARLLEENGFEIHYNGYFGNFAFWVKQPERLQGFSKLIYRMVCYLSVFFHRFIPFESSFYSAYCGVIAKKK